MSFDFATKHRAGSSPSWGAIQRPVVAASAIPVAGLLAVATLHAANWRRRSGGCNIGAYFSALASGSLSAWVWVAAAFAGSALGLRLRPLLDAA